MVICRRVRAEGSSRMWSRAALTSKRLAEASHLGAQATRQLPYRACLALLLLALLPPTLSLSLPQKGFSVPGQHYRDP